MLSAEIDPLGAELQSLTDSSGAQYMSAGDPAFWSGRAPLLFPNVGRLAGDVLRVDGKTYPMCKHGFARRARFDLVGHDVDTARFRLTDSDATRASYPFAFTLDMEFCLDGMSLAMTATIGNPDDEPLPASFGFHPAFAWPLPSAAREDHEIRLARDEPSPLTRVRPDGLIEPSSRPSPVAGNTVRLDDALFVDDALVWQSLASRSLSYGCADGPALDIDFPDTPSLGIWTKPGAAFICIEPWAGYADSVGFTGNFADKPGVFEVAPRDAVRFRMTVTVRHQFRKHL